MSLNKIIAISGEQGLYKLVSNKASGLILENLDTNKKKFYASRTYQFTPLESISVYTDDGDAVELKKVFQNILDNEATNPVIPHKSSNEELYAFLKSILPNYDADRVYPNDVKKIIKWFGFLKKHELLNFEEEAETEAEETAE